MRAVIQRVTHAHLTVDGADAGSIGQGFVVLLGIGSSDGEQHIEKLWSKISKLRIFPDGEHATGAALSDVGGNVMVVSQFTLYANCRKGNRPSFSDAGTPDVSERLYEAFLARAKQDFPELVHGEFGADMQIELVNDGPFTICLDTDDLM